MAREPDERTTPLPATRVAGPTAPRAAGMSFVLLLVLTGTVAAAVPGGIATDSGRRSAAMLMATLQDAARRLADAEEAAAPRAAAVAVPRPRVLAGCAQTPAHTDPPRESLCVLPPPAA